MKNEPSSRSRPTTFPLRMQRRDSMRWQLERNHLPSTLSSAKTWLKNDGCSLANAISPVLCSASYLIERSLVFVLSDNGICSPCSLSLRQDMFWADSATSRQCNVGDSLRWCSLNLQLAMGMIQKLQSRFEHFTWDSELRMIHS